MQHGITTRPQLILPMCKSSSRLLVPAQHYSRELMTICRLTPLVRRRRREEGFLIGFARHFVQHSTASFSRGVVARDLFVSLANENTSEPSLFLTPNHSLSSKFEATKFGLTPADLAGFILDLASFDCPKILGRTVERIVSAVSKPNFTLDDYKTFWLPFLHNLLDLLASNFVPLSPSPIGKLFRTILQHYPHVAVGMQPLPHNGNWSIMRAFAFTHNGECSTCDPVVAFLRSPSERTKSFKIPASQKEHISRALGWMKDLEVRVDKSSRPFTTTLRKKGEGDEEDLMEWEKRRKTARETLAEFDEGNLVLLLGSSYPEIMYMHGIKRGGDTRQPTDPSDRVVLGANAPSVTAAGTKRRADTELDANRTAPARVQSGD
jgi:hypothetical protein